MKTTTKTPSHSFNKDIEKLFTLCHEYFDLGETIIDYFYNSRTGLYEYSEDAMFNVLYELVNYDMICIDEKSIDVEYSNETDIAKIIKRYATAETINKVYTRIY